MKRCWQCGETKPYTEFHNHRGRPDGYSSNCKPCANKWQRDYAKANRQRVNEIARKARWGLTPEDIVKRLADQLELCASCGDYLEKPEVDHDHDTGQIRDLLCGPCNKALGQLKDSSKRAYLVAQYLERWGK